MLIPMSTLVEQHGVRPRGVLHLGAHTGEEAEDYARAGVARVVWFEANPNLIPQLERHLAGFPDQLAVHAAVSDRDDCQVELHIASNGQSSSLLRMKRHRDRYPEIEQVASALVRTITIDSFLQRAGLAPADFDFANLDLQGGELTALCGMRRCLPHLRWIYAEVNFEELYESCPLVGELDRFLLEQRFDRVAMVDSGYGWGDALYVRRRPDA